MRNLTHRLAQSGHFFQNQGTFFSFKKSDFYQPADTGRKLNVHKTFRKRPGRLLNVLCTLNLRPVSTGKGSFRILSWNSL